MIRTTIKSEADITNIINSFHPSDTQVIMIQDVDDPMFIIGLIKKEKDGNWYYKYSLKI